MHVYITYVQLQGFVFLEMLLCCGIENFPLLGSLWKIFILFFLINLSNMINEQMILPAVLESSMEGKGIWHEYLMEIVMVWSRIYPSYNMSVRVYWVCWWKVSLAKFRFVYIKESSLNLQVYVSPVLLLLNQLLEEVLVEQFYFVCSRLLRSLDLFVFVSGWV